jgi:hypothetical protein
LITYKWPRRVRATTVVYTLAGAVALVVASVLLTNANQHPVCGGVQLGPADQCDFNGSVVSSAQLTNSPLPAVLFAAAAGLVGWLLVVVRRSRKLTRLEISNFEQWVSVRRRIMPTLYRSSPEWQGKWATPDEVLALFDKQVERVRERRGFSASKVKT